LNARITVSHAKSLDTVEKLEGGGFGGAWRGLPVATLSLGDLVIADR